MSVPDPLGRDRLAAGAAMYKQPVYGGKPPAKPFYLRPSVIALAVAAAITLSLVVYRLASTAEDTPQAAATRVIELFLKADYDQLRSKLCREDREQVGANDLETAGRTAGPLLKTLDKPRVISVVDVTLQGDYAGVPAKQVSGQITALVGDGTAFTVVTIKQDGGWRACLSPGGYGLSAFHLSVPVGGPLTGIN